MKKINLIFILLVTMSIIGGILAFKVVTKTDNCLFATTTSNGIACPIVFTNNVGLINGTSTAAYGYLTQGSLCEQLAIPISSCLPHIEYDIIIE